MSLSNRLYFVVVLSVVVAVSRVNASLDPHTPFIYSHLYALDLSESDAEKDEQNESNFTPSQQLSNAQQIPVVSNSQVVYNDQNGCLVSSQTVMDDESKPLLNDGHFFISYNKGDNNRNDHCFDSDFYESDEDADEDNDDDDGHSSMLSTASLMRSAGRISSFASGSTRSSTRSYQSQQRSSSRSVSFGDSLSCDLSKEKHTAAKSMLQLRGGAAAMSTGSELFKKLFVTALVTLVFEGTTGHVLEFLKIAMQTAPEGATYLKVIQGITAEKGLLGLYDGFIPWGVVQSVFKGAVFGLAHASSIKLLVPLADKGIIPLALALTLAGGIGGGFQGYVLSPTLLLKTRVMTDPVFREKMSLLRTIILSFTIGFDVVRNEGLSSLMKGANVFATKRVFDWSTRYFFSDWFESIFVKIKGKELSVAEKSTASFLGGIASTCCTLPLDVLVAKTQDAKKAGVKVSALAMFKDELAEKGLSGLRRSYMQGFEARVAHVCLTTVVVKTFVPVVYNLLYGEKE